MSVYRESSPPTKLPHDHPDAPRCDDSGCTMPPCADCGCAHDVHHWFNSEFLWCGGKGYYSESVINGKVEKHQREAHCKCNYYRQEKLKR